MESASGGATSAAATTTGAELLQGCTPAVMPCSNQQVCMADGDVLGIISEGLDVHRVLTGRSEMTVESYITQLCLRRKAQHTVAALP